jgi:two-component system, NarL family, nitrate/nitrite response regulator NarL
MIADDHPLVRDGLRLCIQRNGNKIEIVGEAADGLEVLQLAKSLLVDVFILDITMPSLNGLDAARELIRQRQNAKVIILSINHSRDFLESAIEIGVRGYLTKETASRKIVEAVCEVHAGRFYFSPDIAHYVVEKALVGATKSRFLQMASLTVQERKVLQLIAEGWTAKEVALELGCAANTIHSHRRNLMTKLNIHKGTELARFAVKEGIAKL